MQNKFLFVGITAYAIGIILLPAELKAAKTHQPVRVRTVATLLCFLTASGLVLKGVSAKDASAKSVQ